MQSDSEQLLRGIQKIGLTSVPPGFAPRPVAQNVDLDDNQLTSIFRLALEEEQHQHNQNQIIQNSASMTPEVFFAQHQQQQARGFPPQQQQQQQYPPSYPPQQFPSFEQQQQQNRMPPPQQFFQGPPLPFDPQQRPPPFGFMPPPGGFPRFIPQPRFDNIPIQQQQQQTSGDGLRFQDYERMKGKEIASIVRSQLRSVETGDDYSDDYYFLQLEEKKRLTASRKQQEQQNSNQKFLNVTNSERPAEVLKILKAIRNRTSTDSNTRPVFQAPLGPLPELPGQKPAQLEEMERKSKAVSSAATKWAGAKNVLGRSTRSNLRTPRELIALHDSIMNNEEENINGEKKKQSFSSAGWKLRHVTNEVSDRLGEITDLNRLLKAKAAALPPGPPTAEWEPVRNALSALEAKQNEVCESLAKEMGLIEANDTVLLSLLWLPRGRRLACKAARCLLPDHLLLFLEAASRVLVYLTCTSPDGENSKIPLEREKFELDIMCADMLVQEYELLDLPETCKCLKLLLGSQTPDSLRAVMATPGGAQVVKCLLLHGQADADISQDLELKKTWDDSFSEFITMAEEGISAKEKL